MNTYRVTGYVTIEISVEIEAQDEEKAKELFKTEESLQGHDGELVHTDVCDVERIKEVTA